MGFLLSLSLLPQADRVSAAATTSAAAGTSFLTMEHCFLVGRWSGAGPGRCVPAPWSRSGRTTASGQDTEGHTGDTDDDADDAEHPCGVVLGGRRSGGGLLVLLRGVRGAGGLRGIRTGRGGGAVRVTGRGGQL